MVQNRGSVKRKSNLLLSIWWLAALAIFLVVGNVGTTCEGKALAENGKAKAVLISAEEANNIQVYKRTNRAVVNIANISNVQDPFFNVIPQEGCGSGTIFSKDGY